MKKILIDTTYVLPLFGFEVNGVNLTDERIFSLWNNGIPNCEIFLSSISLMEVLFRINAEIRKNSTEECSKRYEITLPTVLNSKIVKIFTSLTDLKVAEYTFKIRKLGHQDLFNCIIAATAYSLDGILISEDSPLKKRIDNEMTQKIRVFSLDQFLKKN
jgi:predicted nucleic acid-binding protein